MHAVVPHPELLTLLRGSVPAVEPEGWPTRNDRVTPGDEHRRGVAVGDHHIVGGRRCNCSEVQADLLGRAAVIVIVAAVACILIR